jgi:hypothetical protein
MGSKFNAMMWSLLEHATDFVETGTMVGTTSAAVARDFDIPVWTCEINTDYICRALENLPERVRLCRMPSDLFLTLVDPELGRLPLFFLDAHGWGGGHPLLGELSIIDSDTIKAVIIIHDFKVDGFRYVHGDGVTYDFDYITPVLSSERRYRFFLPAYKPAEGEICTGYLVIFQDVEPFGDLKNLVEVKR